MKKLLVFVAMIAAAQSAPAATFVFDFASTTGSNQAGLDLDGLASGSSTVTSGFSVTMSASANIGVFNRTTTSPNFGINVIGAGDVTDAFDDGLGTEIATLSFTASMPANFTFVSIDFDRISGSGGPGTDQGTLSFSGGSTINFDGTTVDGSDLLTVGESFVAGQSIRMIPAIVARHTQNGSRRVRTPTRFRSASLIFLSHIFLYPPFEQMDFAFPTLLC